MELGTICVNSLLHPCTVVVLCHTSPLRARRVQGQVVEHLLPALLHDMSVLPAVLRLAANPSEVAAHRTAAIPM